MRISSQERMLKGREGYSPDTLLRELARLADIHKDFRQRTVGEWSLNLAASDPIQEQDYLARTEEGIIKPPLIINEYSFVATRERWEPKLEAVGYRYGFIASMHNIALPEHIARFAFGAYRDPLAQAALGSKTQSVEIDINTHDRVLHACQNVAYFKDETQIAVVSTDMEQDDESATIHSFIDLSDDPEEVTNPAHFNAPPPLQFHGDAARHLEASAEPLDARAEQWLTGELNLDAFKLDIAYFTLRSMKRAMRTQLGMNV